MAAKGDPKRNENDLPALIKEATKAAHKRMADQEFPSETAANAALRRALLEEYAKRGLK
jgi:hypothetical protein